MKKKILKKVIILSFLMMSFTETSITQNAIVDNDINQLIDSIACIVEEDRMVGLMLGIATCDSVLFSGGFGYADVASGRRVDENTLFRMGSITKMFISLGIMKLVEEGKLNLNDELKKILPDVVVNNKWEARHPVKLVHLLEHTTGFDDFKINKFYTYDKIELTGEDMILIHQKSMICRWKPGERFAYSNVNYSILGYIIEKITNQAYDVYLKNIILLPQDMINSNFNLYRKNDDKDVREYIIKNNEKLHPVESVTILGGPQGALWSSSKEMLHFLQLFLRKGKPYFDPQTIEEIETTHSSLAAKFGLKNGYALANFIDFSDKKYPFRGHDGWIGTCHSYFFYNRELDIGFVLSCNSNNPSNRIIDLIFSYLEPSFPGITLATQTLNKEEVQAYLGRYQFDSPRFKLSSFNVKLQNAPKIYVEGNSLYHKPLIGASTELLQTSPLTFAFKGDNIPSVCFGKDDEGNKVMMLAGSYYRKTSNVVSLLQRGIFGLALLIMLSLVLVGLISIIGAFIHKLSWKESAHRLVPLVGIGCLALSLINIWELQSVAYKLALATTINSFSLTIFLGGIIFLIASIWSLVYAIHKIRISGLNWFRAYYLLAAISMCSVLIIFYQNGWIGLCSWAL